MLSFDREMCLETTTKTAYKHLSGRGRPIPCSCEIQRKLEVSNICNGNVPINGPRYIIKKLIQDLISSCKVWKVDLFSMNMFMICPVICLLIS